VQLCLLPDISQKIDNTIGDRWRWMSSDPKQDWHSKSARNCFHVERTLRHACYFCSLSSYRECATCTGCIRQAFETDCSFGCARKYCRGCGDIHGRNFIFARDTAIPRGYLFFVEIIEFHGIARDHVVVHGNMTTGSVARFINEIMVNRTVLRDKQT